MDMADLETIQEITKSIYNCFDSPVAEDSHVHVNVVDGLFAIADAINTLRVRLEEIYSLTPEEEDGRELPDSPPSGNLS